MIRVLLVVLGLFVPAAVPGQESTESGCPATALFGTPTVDGKMEPAWKQAQVLHVRQVVAEGLNMDGKQAATAEVRLMWDRTALYMFWVVKDRQLSAVHADPWQQDSIEFFIDENAAGSESYEEDDLQCRISFENYVTGGAGYNPDDLTSSVRKIDGGYTVELSLAWRTIEPEAKQVVGLELQINDDAGNGQRDAIMKWCRADDRSWTDTSGFGRLTLLPEGEKAPTEPSRPGSDHSSQHGVRKSSNTNTATATAKVTQDMDTDTRQPTPALEPASAVPAWVTDAVFYQIFPERFRNGDTRNDPTRESLEFPSQVPRSWRISPWGGDWYARDSWERERGNNFYEHGVFDRRYGGDLQGVLDKLDYLKDLGINAIYFNPVFYARSLHKYDGASMHHVDPHFGPDPQGDLRIMAQETSDPQSWQWTAADKLFLKLIDRAHAQGIRIIIDGVFNHTGQTFFAFDDLRRRGKASPYRDWYVVKSFDDPRTKPDEFDYQCWWGVKTLPEFANNARGDDLHPGPREYLLNITRRWMDPNGDGSPEDGIDGWRLDVANEVPDRFWVDWNRLVRGINPQAYTVAEFWHEASGYLTRCGFSATMNYHSFAYPLKGYLMDGTSTPSECLRVLEEGRRALDRPRQFASLNLLDSHDTDRVASMIVNGGRTPYRQPARYDYDVSERTSPRFDPSYDVSRPKAEHRRVQRLVALFQMTYVGSPMIYYGTEAGMWGADDPDDRMPMVWPDLEYQDQASHPLPQGKRPVDPVSFDHNLHAYYRSLVALRHQEAALRRGAFQVLASDDAQQSLIFSRTLGDDRIYVAINRAPRGARLVCTPPPGADSGPQRWKLLLSSDPAIRERPLEFPAREWVITIPATTGLIYKAMRREL